jgi:hypothetical protein
MAWAGQRARLRFSPGVVVTYAVRQISELHRVCQRHPTVARAAVSAYGEELADSYEGMTRYFMADWRKSLELFERIRDATVMRSDEFDVATSSRTSAIASSALASWPRSGLGQLAARHR